MSLSPSLRSSGSSHCAMTRQEGKSIPVSAELVTSDEEGGGAGVYKYPFEALELGRGRVVCISDQQWGVRM